MSARAALDAARAVFEPSMGRAPLEATTTPVWREWPSGTSTPRARGVGMWRAAELVVQTVVGRDELTGQAVVGEARRRQLLTMADAHALMVLQGWVDKQREAADADTDALSSDSERMIATEAFLALEHAVASASASAFASTQPPLSVPSSGGATAAQPQDVARSTSWATPNTIDAAPDGAAVPTRRSWYSRPAFLFALIMLVVIGGASAWLLLAGRRSGGVDEGVAAYTRGARGTARAAFQRQVTAHPDDARSLVYLGRIAREENDLARARRLLDAAVRIEPTNALAQRELASAMLADGQPELARRRYVRSIELDPSDRVAQGFLGCALHRLGRDDEAIRWAQRAGPGEWMPCLATTVFAPPGAAPTPP